MSESVEKGLHIRLSIELRRQVKVAAAGVDKTIQDWMREAAEAKLREQARFPESV